MAAQPDALPTDLLDEIELFRALNTEERAFLAQRMVRRLFRRGELLITQGEPTDSVFLVGSGLVSILHEDADGSPTEIAQSGRGTLLGEMSLLTGNPPSATVVALLECEVWLLGHEDFQALLSRSVALALSVNRALSAKLAATNERLTPRRSARLAALLCDGGPEETRRLPLAIAQSLAWHSRERVLLVDCVAADDSPLRDVPAWGEPVTRLLRDRSLLSAHAAPPELSGPHSGARLLRYSDNPQALVEPGALLSLATRLRHLYRHILFHLPTAVPGLLGDLLPMVDDVLLISHRDRLHMVGGLLARPSVAAAQGKGALVVTGWPGRWKMGELRAVERRHGWPVGALVREGATGEGVGRVARRLARMRVGIAWGGGTARGWALAGIANALEQLGVPMDFFAGTSAGALGAAVYGLTLDYKQADQRMRRVLPYLQRTTRFMLPLTVSRHSLLSERWWNDLIRTFVEELSFDDLLLPYAAVALDLTTGRQQVFTEGPLWKAIRASAAVPVLAPPMVIEGKPYADGGVVNAVPLDVVRDLGADVLVGIDLTGSETATEWGEHPKPSMLGTLTRTINVAYNTAASRTIPLADVLIRPTLRSAAVYDISVMDEFMAEGERATLAARDALLAAMPWLAAPPPR